MKKEYQHKYFKGEKTITLALILSVVVLALCIQSKAQTQSFIGSSVKLSTDTNGIIKTLVNENAVISLNDGSNDFSVSVSLFPIVNNPDREDSLADANKLLLLTFNGKFPIENFSFYSDKSSNTTYTMNGLLAVNGIANPYTLIFAVRTPLTANPTNEDVVPLTDDAYYPAKISFSITINPADFGLDIEPIAIKNEVIVEVGEGIINKLD